MDSVLVNHVNHEGCVSFTNTFQNQIVNNVLLLSEAEYSSEGFIVKSPSANNNLLIQLFGRGESLRPCMDFNQRLHKGSTLLRLYQALSTSTLSADKVFCKTAAALVQPTTEWTPSQKRRKVYSLAKNLNTHTTVRSHQITLTFYRQNGFTKTHRIWMRCLLIS